MIIFLDLDGVIINWVQGVFKWFGKPYDPEKVTSYGCMPKLFDVDQQDFWNIIKTPIFWEYLEFYPEAKSFIEKLQQYGQVILLSSPAYGCAGYRQNWIEQNLPDFFNRGEYILTPAKWACAHSGTVLIDDHSRNYKEFIKNGGQAILYPQPWNDAGKQLAVENLSEKEKNALIIEKLLTIIK
jgi:5'(3')-deoxyribonucleotidase